MNGGVRQRRTAMGRISLSFAVIAASLFLVASLVVISLNSDRVADDNGGTENFIPRESRSSSGIPDTDWYTADTGALTFTITNADELAGLAELVNSGINFAGRTITLDNNIDLSLYGASYNGGKGWIPIGSEYAKNFRGTFDGNWKRITGLYINDAGTSYRGLFGVVYTGTVMDVGVEGVNITGGQYVGGIAGHVYKGNVINCYSTGSITSDRYAGGIAGIINGDRYGGSSIVHCYSQCDVSGNKFIGGILGLNDTGNVTNCYSTGTVSGSESIGGIAGNISSGNVTNCAALNAAVTGETYVGRVAGNILSGGTCTDNQAVRTMSTTPSRPDGDNGADITRNRINSDGSIGGIFTEDGGWTVENGKLPGLFGETVEMPPHIARPARSATTEMNGSVMIIIGIAGAAMIVSILLVHKLAGRKRA